MAGKTVTVATASGMMEAEILRGMLQAQGIDVWLRHESAGAAIGLGVGPLAQVDIMVRPEQAGAALEMLTLYQSGGLAEPESDEGNQG